MQTLAIPESVGQSNVLTNRYEEKIIMDKTVEVSAEAIMRGKGKGKERETDEASSAHEEQGIHLGKGLHGFEFAFIIPASSAPFDRAKNGRIRYTLTATAIGAGRGRAHVSASREIFIILQVNADGGPTPLDIQYHDVHEALGALSVSLTSANLTVGGTANLSLYHPTPPPGLSVHVARVFLEQTVELYSELRKGWMKLPVEKLRLWERGYMPYKEKAKQLDPSSSVQDSLWIRADDGVSTGKPGRAVTNSHHPHQHHPASGTLTPGGTLTPTQDGYKLKSVVRLPDDNAIRPSTVRGSRAEVRISHELGVEIFFSRAAVLDERETSESYGKPKVQVFSMRRATIIPSCLATFDTIHLPPYTAESPLNSRPPSPTHFSPSSLGSMRGRDVTTAAKGQASQVELEYWKLTQSLRAALPHASGGGTNGVHSAEHSHPPSQPASRNTSPSRQHGLFGRKSRNTSPNGHGRKSRPASPTGTHGAGAGGATTAAVPHSPTHSTGIVRKGVPSLHALTPAHVHSPVFHGHVSTTMPTVVTAPASGTTTPKSLPANSPWALSNLPPRTSTSHSTCQCGRSTEELIEAESRLLDGAATAPGIFSNAHDEGQLPPPWTPSRPSSPTDEQVTGWITSGASHGEGVRARGAKVGEMLCAE